MNVSILPKSKEETRDVMLCLPVIQRDLAIYENVSPLTALSTTDTIPLLIT
jgi:hypothetical protein